MELILSISLSLYLLHPISQSEARALAALLLNYLRRPKQHRAEDKLAVTVRRCTPPDKPELHSPRYCGRRVQCQTSIQQLRDEIWALEKFRRVNGHARVHVRRPMRRYFPGQNFSVAHLNVSKRQRGGPSRVGEGSSIRVVDEEIDVESQVDL